MDIIIYVQKNLAVIFLRMLLFYCQCYFFPENLIGKTIS